MTMTMTMLAFLLLLFLLALLIYANPFAFKFSAGGYIVHLIDVASIGAPIAKIAATFAK